jgi:hypothetical protein
MLQKTCPKWILNSDMEKTQCSALGRPHPPCGSPLGAGVTSPSQGGEGAGGVHGSLQAPSTLIALFKLMTHAMSPYGHVEVADADAFASLYWLGL